MICKNGGGIHFTFRHNCIIQSLTWNECSKTKQPGLKLRDSSNITIQNCSFQHSRGQAVVLSEVSGDVNVNHCKFVNNTHYRGHGAAIHYSSNDSSKVLFTINNCNFTHNEKAKSLVYTENSISNQTSAINFCYLKFYHNQGMVNQNVYFSEKVSLQNNIATSGTGIYISDHSTVVFDDKDSDVAFVQNTAKLGGTIFLKNHSNIIFAQNSKVIFKDNINSAIYFSTSSNMTFAVNCHVILPGSSANAISFLIV